MNFLSPLWNLSFWFDLTPTRMSAAFEAGFFGFFALAIIAGSVIRMVIRNGKYDRYQIITLKKIASLCSAAGVVGLQLTKGSPRVKSRRLLFESRPTQ